MPRNPALILSAALINIVLLFAIGLAFRQVDNERIEQIRDREIVVECNQVTRLFKGLRQFSSKRAKAIG
ncbi:MAG: hypothetical protein Q8T09_18445 [Candidatus Melainabacteria bacterium]|nr:hypothetical protein [Candidatus Melainabacteria bacterium]